MSPLIIYICANCDNRSFVLSIVAGLISAGATLGPIISGILIATSQQVRWILSGAVFLLACIVVVVVTILQESLPQGQMVANNRHYAAQQAGGSVLGKVFAPLIPLGILLPVRLETTYGTGTQSKRDWNLTLIACAYMSTVMTLVSKTGDAIATSLPCPQGYVSPLLRYIKDMFEWTGAVVSD
jgi:MFS family permease